MDITDAPGRMGERFHDPALDLVDVRAVDLDDALIDGDAPPARSGRVLIQAMLYVPLDRVVSSHVRSQEVVSTYDARQLPQIVHDGHAVDLVGERPAEWWGLGVTGAAP